MNSSQPIVFRSGERAFSLQASFRGSERLWVVLATSVIRRVSRFKERRVVIDAALRDDIFERKDEKKLRRHTVEP